MMKRPFLFGLAGCLLLLAVTVGYWVAIETSRTEEMLAACCSSLMTWKTTLVDFIFTLFPFVVFGIPAILAFRAAKRAARR
jgi:Na+/H+-dicarboxylate symporter